MSDPTPVAFALFALAFEGIRFIDVGATTVASSSTSVALAYTFLVAGAAETLAGILGIVRGDGFAATVTCTFGIWLLGFDLLDTKGAATEGFMPNALTTSLSSSRSSRSWRSCSSSACATTP